ncbi:integrase core domain-containing protein [Marinilabiliaceae bacterium ANBcel2]|nr:integrase core domain-containing protein [Marinilabiliaceae bacterium ANBcel2]
MAEKGRGLDNIYIERLWRTVKRDYIYLNPADNGLELYQGLKNWFKNYNYYKHHQGINRTAPYNLFKTKDSQNYNSSSLTDTKIY